MAQRRWGLLIAATGTIGALAATSCAAPPAPAGPRAGTASASTVAEADASVIVRQAPGRDAAPRVRALGGRVVGRIGIIDALVAVLPAEHVAELRRAPGVAAVTPNARVRLMGGGDTDPGAMGAPRNLATITGARSLWKRGITGAGVDVALIDSGIVPVQGLQGADKIAYGPDLSFESQSDSLRHLDTMGHGTHMAGIIAGRDAPASGETYAKQKDGFLGTAPDARIISVKVADATGATDVSQVLAAIDWVVQHRNTDGLNIRVLNLSFGTDSVQDYRLDPLAYAAEVAWRRGIVVVTAAGNGGEASTRLTDPAFDPFVVAVGAADPRGTTDVADDVVAGFSSRSASRPPDLVAPGKSIVGLRDPGSWIDTHYPSAREGERLFRGSGTSQAAAIVSGAAALLVQQRPQATPDQIKALLVGTASPLDAPSSAQGAGELNLHAAQRARTPQVVQTWEPSTGTGTLEGARGSMHVQHEGVVLTGEQDIFGHAFDTSAWSRSSLDGSSWS